MRLNPFEGLEGFRNELSHAANGHDRVDDVSSIRRRAGVPHGMPGREERVIDRTCDVSKRIDEQTSKAPQAKNKDDRIVEFLADFWQAVQFLVKCTSDDRSQQERTKENHRKACEEVCITMFTCHDFDFIRLHLTFKV